MKTSTFEKLSIILRHCCGVKATRKSGGTLPSFIIPIFIYLNFLEVIFNKFPYASLATFMLENHMRNTFYVVY